MRRVTLFAVLALMTATAASAQGAWSIIGSPEVPPFVLVLSIDPDPKKRGYFFDCSAKERVQITQTGVTSLAPDMPPFMSLSVDDTSSDVVIASRTRNPDRGTDLTITISKTDRAFVALPKAKFMTLFSPGDTIGVVLDDDDRTTIARFVQRCVVVDTQ